MILSCHNISKSFGTDVIIENASFNIEDREKAAIVGINGAGKSTLLKIIMNEIQQDSGSVVISKDKTIGFLSQHQDFSKDNTIYNEVLETKRDIIDMEIRIRDIEKEMAGKNGEELNELMNIYSKLTNQFDLNNGYSYKSEITGILKGLGFLESDFDKNVKELSGGQKTRVALGKLLVSKPDIILLDEPTNHLDMQSIEWLETFLLNYPGAVIIVAHDRYFLDKICTKIIDIDNGKVRVYSGNYTQYADKKKQLREARIKEYLNQQREIKHQEEVIEKLKSFNREKSIKRAESRQKMLEKMDIIDKPEEVNNSIKLNLEPEIESGKDVLEATALSKSFEKRVLFDDLNFEIKRGERVALIGQNGTGKTTILKIINGIYEADKGSIKLGAKVNIGYYDQEHQQLNLNNTAFDEIADSYPDLTETKIRNTLAAFLFTNDDVFKKINDLSGGERGRIALAKLMLSKANFLILDEPTNHLDIDSKEILENVLNNYTGTVFFVSHDRYFINETATRILELTDKTLINYIGNYDYYLNKRDELKSIYIQAESNVNNVVQTSNSKADWKEKKDAQAIKRKFKNRLKKTEEEIQKTENRIADIDEKLCDESIATDVAKLMEYHNEKEKLNSKLDELYEEWEEIMSQDEN